MEKLKVLAAAERKKRVKNNKIFFIKKVAIKKSKKAKIFEKKM